MSLRDAIARLARLLGRNAGRTAAAVSIATVAASTADAQATPATPARPRGSAARDTVHRYGEKFVLTPSDSVVIRGDTVWYPRVGAKTKASAAPPSAAASSGSTTTGTAPLPRIPSVGGHGSHASHSSHSSHRSMVGYRRGH
jgi:hypothetical protein